MRINEHGQPVGDDLGDWQPPPYPPHRRLLGRYCTLEPLTVEDHAAGIVDAFADAPDSLWTYLHWGPLPDVASVAAVIGWLDEQPDWLPYAIVVDGVVSGFESYLRIDPPNGVIEIGGIAFAPGLQRTRAATESIFLLIDACFDLGYRRCEWKCDDLNAPSRAAAERYGFRYEGTFRKATHYRGRSRDTAWYAITDDDWPPLRRSFEAWLDPANFDAAGVQRRSLAELRTSHDRS